MDGGDRAMPTLEQYREQYRRWFDTAVKIPAEAGDAVTISIGSDRYPGTILDNTSKVWVIQHDRERVISGSPLNGTAEYEYFKDPAGRIDYFRREKDGQFVMVERNPETGRWNKVSSAYRLTVGHRRYYQDPHF